MLEVVVLAGYAEQSFEKQEIMSKSLPFVIDLGLKINADKVSVYTTDQVLNTLQNIPEKVEVFTSFKTFSSKISHVLDRYARHANVVGAELLFLTGDSFNALYDESVVAVNDFLEQSRSKHLDIGIGFARYSMLERVVDSWKRLGLAMQDGLQSLLLEKPPIPFVYDGKPCFFKENNLVYVKLEPVLITFKQLLPDFYENKNLQSFSKFYSLLRLSSKASKLSRTGFFRTKLSVFSMLYLANFFVSRYLHRIGVDKVFNNKFSRAEEWECLLSKGFNLEFGIVVSDCKGSALLSFDADSLEQLRIYEAVANKILGGL
ncbi:hypothetical protein J7L02_00120 [Candidatus Woesearchaeota archaeon]|nr:hypothetical protein [Candidatus Woesearchaeota archaeon]